MAPSPYHTTRVLPSVSDATDIRDILTQGDDARLLLRDRWPISSLPIDSGLCCVVALMRQIYFGMDSEEANNDEGVASKLAWRAGALRVPADHLDARAEMLRCSITDYSFDSIQSSKWMLSGFWARLDFQLFWSARKDGDLPWKDEKVHLADVAKSQVIEINNQEQKTTGFDIPAAIDKRCGPFPIPGSETSTRFYAADTPKFIRVRFTPSVEDNETLESVQAFQMMLPHGGDFPQRSMTRYTLSAAVRLSAAGDIDRIRLFDAEGRDVFPDSDSPYADMAWELCVPGHSYFLCYVLSDTPLKNIPPQYRLVSRRLERLRAHRENEARRKRSEACQKSKEALGQFRASMDAATITAPPTAAPNNSPSVGTASFAGTKRPVREILATSQSPRPSKRNANLESLPTTSDITVTPDIKHKKKPDCPNRAVDWIPSYKDTPAAWEEEVNVDTRFILLFLITGGDKSYLKSESFRAKWRDAVVNHVYPLFRLNNRVWISQESIKYQALKYLYMQMPHQSEETFKALMFGPPHNNVQGADEAYKEWLKANHRDFWEGHRRKVSSLSHNPQ